MTTIRTHPLATILAALVAVFTLLLLTACGAPGIKSDAAFSGSLPRALGVGAFASQCFFLCFVSAQFTQGNVDETEGSPDSSVRHRRSNDAATGLKSPSHFPPSIGEPHPKDPP